MSLTMIIALATAGTPAVANNVITAADRPAVAAAAARMNVPTRRLLRAMSEPVSTRQSPDQVRYCIERDRVVPGRDGMVCRTENQWARYGLIIPEARG
ncbi:MAG: hypothetical protein K2X31_00230 [Sphingopyxis sp.]|nr:hypothetical protein [Sphingopyxis sp.]